MDPVFIVFQCPGAPYCCDDGLMDVRTMVLREASLMLQP